MGSVTLAASILDNIAKHAQQRLDAGNEEMSLGEIVTNQLRNGTISVDELNTLARGITHPDHPDLTARVDFTVGHEKIIFSSSRLANARREAIRHSRH